MLFYGFGGTTVRNQPIKVAARNPLEDAHLTHGSGDAGKDGYTTLSTADRSSRRRPPYEGSPVWESPRTSED